MKRVFLLFLYKKFGIYVSYYVIYIANARQNFLEQFLSGHFSIKRFLAAFLIGTTAVSCEKCFVEKDKAR